MGLRGSTLAVVGLLLTGLFAAALTISARLVVANDRAAQQRATQERVRATAAEFRHDEDVLLRSGTLLSHRDITWEFAAGQRSELPETHLRGVFAALDVDALLVLGRSGATWSASRTKRGGVPGPVPAALLGELRSLAGRPGPDDLLFVHDGEPWLAVVLPVLHGDASGPPAGALVLARELDSARLAHLGHLFDGIVSLRRGADTAGTPEAYLSASAPLQHESSGGEPWSLVLIRRPAGAEVLSEQLLLLGGNLLVVGLFAAAIILLVVDRMVLRRLQHFASEAARIRAGVIRGLRLPVRSNDELDRLASSINALLDQVDTTTSQLRHDALHDPLTGLANRTLLFDRIAIALGRSARAPSPGVALLFLDLDRLKVINDHLGHAAGDHFIVELARRLAAGVRPGDTVARLGGDEFAILLQDIPDATVAAARGEAVLDLVRRPMVYKGTAYNVSASVGLVVATAGHDPASLVREADMAMYEAKAGGRNRLATYDAVLHGRLAERLAIEQALRNALEAGEIEIVLQPILTAATGVLVGFEALARWEHPSLGVVPPSRFITIAEETQLVVAVDRYVLDRALAAIAQLRHSGRPLSVSVNHSARAMDAADVVDFVTACLARHNVPASALILEITETQLTRNEERWLPRIQALVERGVRFALDDFGLGYSSLARLHHIPVAVLKLDREFVHAMGAGQDAVARAILGMAQELNRLVIAEGVETDEERSRLVELGCPLVQGYLIGHPDTLAAHLERLGLTPNARRGVG
jgi:diguanylate cyclase (GGDEF)-like protein